MKEDNRLLYRHLDEKNLKVEELQERLTAEREHLDKISRQLVVQQSTHEEESKQHEMTSHTMRSRLEACFYHFH